ncbi:PREDICTED: probable LRR receptor-like serine/threonine-protein kinase At1g56140 isoform X2 [Populus euphratica]|uniref:non-specific serine/threonine protein kinase n=1 Tax=Populus euphratica TaxID=75702 RepID=A0AAJ6U493_POPEU|nr:PREDICTED: probable LRR receptor-like serine/threonine-protein kinase At1g56140 isoform X2 [Populus euphratica]
MPNRKKETSPAKKSSSLSLCIYKQAFILLCIGLKGSILFLSVREKMVLRVKLLSILQHLLTTFAFFPSSFFFQPFTCPVLKTPLLIHLKMVSALNSLFEQWDTQAVGLWNLSGEPCSGSAIEQTDFEDPDNNPAIKCECTQTTCHITQLRVYALNKRGVIPEVLTAFKYLTFLKIDQNYFSGPLPAFIGNLSALKGLSIAHNAFSGTIPKELGNLKELTLLSFGVNNFSGTLPPELGNLVNLEELYTNSCGLGGEIPSTFANLQRLRVLWASDDSFTGNIPDFIGNWTGLTSLDLSYNYLSGTFPSWVASNVQLNLVANNFTFDNSNISVLPGFNCLQRNFPCNRDTPRYANFSIKCGGPEMRTADGTVYEAENSSLSAASFSVTSTEKWAVSNVGLFSDRRSPDYVENTLTQVLSTNTPELYQTSRISPGSLRCFGLGLENGPYTVHLLFAETAFADRSSQTWESLGRRVFDIYIQGSRQSKDFDISKEAGGVERSITRTFNVTVSESHLEIHLFWAGKGTCCTPVQGYYGPIISALNVVPGFTPTVSGIPPSTRKEKSRTGMVVGISVSAGVVCLTLIFAVVYIMRKKDSEDEEVFPGMGSRPNTFSYAQLRAATDDFSPSNMLGEGGFGAVYKGLLSDARAVVVKQLSVASNQGMSQFITEIATISAVQHCNLVKLYGCCIEGTRRLLVYEYLENKSLDKNLFGKDGMHLDWPTRFNICLGTARGLAYLHEESSPRIIHRDVKASNILLDAELCPKISDFGLAKLYDDKKTHISTRVAGTIGYLAPEYAMRGHLTEKADVFGFGVVALEILSGRANSDYSLDDERVYLLEWAWTLYESRQSLLLMDPSVTEFDENEALRVIGVALLCTQASPAMRPTMSRVVAMFTGDIEVSTVTSKPSYLTDMDFKDITGSFSTENTPAFPSTDDSKSKNKSQHHNSIDLSPGGDQIHSPLNITEPRLSDLIGDGR